MSLILHTGDFMTLHVAYSFYFMNKLLMNWVKCKFFLEEGGLVNVCTSTICCYLVQTMCGWYVQTICKFLLLSPATFFPGRFFSFRYMLSWYIIYSLHWIFLTTNQASKGWCCLCWRCWLGEASWSQIWGALPSMVEPDDPHDWWPQREAFYRASGSACEAVLSRNAWLQESWIIWFSAQRTYLRNWLATNSITLLGLLQSYA